jgi:hypothetical protein
VRPQLLDQAVRRHYLVGVDRENREQRALLRAAQPHAPAVHDDVKRAEQPEVHFASLGSGSS